MEKTLEIDCLGYSVTADIYEGNKKGPILLTLIGKPSSRKKPYYKALSTRLAKERGITTVIFDYSGQGNSRFNLADIYPAQHFLEVVTVFDSIKDLFPGRKIIILGSSYGGYLATQLIQYREFDALILRAPSIYRPSDFYTKKADLDDAATEAFVRDKEALSRHPLLARASSYKGKVLLVVHEFDEKIPRETTNAYAKAFKSEVVVAQGAPHSLDKFKPKERLDEYNQAIINWLDNI